MNIREFIESSSNKAAARQELADLIGVEEVTVRSWANGNRHPRRKLWNTIVSVTDGAITLHDLASS